MTPLPPVLGGTGEIVGWTIQDSRFVKTWASGEGAYLFGGRWNSPGRRVIYAALDPATALVEVAVHKGFKVLNTVAHHLHHFTVTDPTAVHVVHEAEVPNPLWLRPVTPCVDQMEFGDALLAAHPFVLIPSAVSPHSWNLLVNADMAAPLMAAPASERLALDPRLRRSSRRT